MDLGFYYDKNPDFGKHIRATCNSAVLRTPNVFSTLASGKINVSKAYGTYIRPLAESSVSVFSPYKEKDIYAIEKVQNNFSRKLFLRTGSFP